MTEILSDDQKARLVSLAEKLIDQKEARIVITPKQSAPGFWFGGGNMAEGENGELYIVGRYRNKGDSRIGLKAGERGMELAVFRSNDQGESFTQLFSFTKKDLSLPDRPILSIEGSSLIRSDSGVELYVSNEKGGVSYPPGFEAYRKPGTGVWSIDCLKADTIEELSSGQVEPVLSSEDPRFLHVKDPVVFRGPSGNTVLVFCTHPYCWTSTNSAICIRPAGGERFGAPNFNFFPRGATWDVAVSRITGILAVPAAGLFFNSPPCFLLFYDGAECVRRLEESALGVSRPRGYSCEEIGGLAVSLTCELTRIERLSTFQPLFVSPYGTGTSRYVNLLATERGLYATWQQSQPDRSQPLVMNFVPDREITEILS